MDYWIDNIPSLSDLDLDDPMSDFLLLQYAYNDLSDIKVVIVCSGLATDDMSDVWVELALDYGSVPKSEDMLGWIEQGVLLLDPNINDDVVAETIFAISEDKQNVVFILWDCRDYVELIRVRRNKLLQSDRPNTPNFMAKRPFTIANDYISEYTDHEPIKWDQ